MTLSPHSMGQYRTMKNTKLTHNWTSGPVRRTRKETRRNESSGSGEHTRVIHPDRKLVWGVTSSGACGVRSSVAVLIGPSLHAL